MSYPIEEIQGIGPAYGKQLSAAGIVTTQDLLELCATPAGRDKIGEACGLSTDQLLSFANMADLMRVSGVGKQFAELLHAAGIDTVKELAARNPDNVAEKLAAVNADKNLAKAVPSAGQLQEWISAAASMDAILTY